MKYLHISNDVKIPLDVVTKRLAFVGTTGSGKSYGAMKLAEELLGSGIQVIVLDPVGIHWGLRLSADQKGPGFPITVFGGLYGDVPITPQSGSLIADVIIDKKISAVIDDRPLPKVIFYILLQEVFGNSFEKDSNGDLGYKMTAEGATT